MDEPGQLSLFHLFRRSINPFREAEEEEKEPPPTTEEIDLLSNLEEYFHTSAQEVMTPRTKMCTLERDKTLNEALEVFHKSGFSRIPVQDQKRDNIVGVAFAIDLFPYVDRLEEITVEQIMRKPLFVSYSKPIHQLLTEFKKENMHLAIVVDEYGGVDGLITVTDIVEELVGDIPDESNKQDDPGWEQVEDGLVVMDAGFELDHFNELYGTDFQKDGIETIGGYACHVLGKIPERGDQFKLENIKVTVEESTDRSIHKLKITAPPSS